MTTNPYEAAARRSKAVGIAWALYAAGSTADQAEQATERVKLDAARAADVRPPSEKTWAMVVEILRDMERQKEQPIDPFEGLV